MYKRFKEWSESGLIEEIFHELAADADLQEIMIDSTSVKAHKASAGAQKGAEESLQKEQENQCIGVSHGGRTTKIHAAVDALGSPITVLLTAGQVHDSRMAEQLVQNFDLSHTTVLADKAYGKFAFREFLADRRADFCIPPKSNEADPWYCDWNEYKERHLVEIFFLKIKEFRRVATRYDKLAKRFLTFVYLTCIHALLA